MYLLFLKFEIQENKLYEFDLAIGRLVKWPVYSLYTPNKDSNKKLFEFTRKWKTKHDMQKDLESSIFTNLIGAIEVLGKKTEFNIYDTNEVTNLIRLNTD